MQTHEFKHAGHTTRVTVTPRDVGWEVQEARDDRILRTVRYTDWHRVERAVHACELASLESTLYSTNR